MLDLNSSCRLGGEDRCSTGRTCMFVLLAYNRPVHNAKLIAASMAMINSPSAHGAGNRLSANRTYVVTSMRITVLTQKSPGKSECSVNCPWSPFNFNNQCWRSFTVRPGLSRAVFDGLERYIDRFRNAQHDRTLLQNKMTNTLQIISAPQHSYILISWKPHWMNACSIGA